MTTTTTQESTRCTVRGGDLIDALAALRPLLSTRKSAGREESAVRLVAGPQGGQVRCCTYEASASAALSVESDVDVDVVVAHADLWRAANAYAARRGAKAAEVLEISTTPQGTVLVTASGERQSSLLLVPGAQDLPQAMEPVAGTTIVQREELVDAVAAAARYAERGPVVLPILRVLRLADGMITATDRYRLARTRLNATGEMPECLPPAQMLAKVLAATRGQSVSLGSDGQHLSVHADNLTATLRCLEGQYPGVEKILANTPTEGYSLHLERSATMAALKAHAAGKATVTLSTLEDGAILAEIRDPGQAEPRATARLQSAGAEPVVLEEPVSFNAQYLLEALAGLQGEVAHIAGVAPLRAAHLRDVADDARLVVQQPVRLAG